ncbi:FAD binding domain-containing protein [Pseudonocardia acaciae]|uniref:FAD binding domain-containing protein n=1 Tax=Pseudonocardia acaciae TaxID=551276 RepID=UPI0006854CD6|nr:FAD binding domain-containing protein [Pseudonocardia acaciae]
MKPARFDYHRARGVADVLGALADDPSGETKVLAGGQSLVTLMNLRLARPARLVDIGGLSELDRVFDDVDRVVLGALVRHRTLETDPLISTRLPLVAAAARHIGHVGIRNRGTVGGSLAHADPAAELPMAMVALGAVVHVESAARGRRPIPAERFFVSHFTTALAPDEIITWVEVPALRPGQGWGFVEYAPRHGDFATAGAGCVLTLDAGGRVSGIRAALLAAADRPLLVSVPDEVLGERPGERLWERLGRRWGRAPLGAEALAEALCAAHRRAVGEDA